MFLQNLRLSFGSTQWGRPDRREAGHGDARGDVVLPLHLGGGHEVLPELEGAAHARLVAADAEVGAQDGPALELEDVAGRAVDRVDGEAGDPVPAPVGPVEALDEEDEGLDALGDGLEPGVVLLGVEGRGREELDDRAEGALLGQEVALVDLAVAEALRVVALDDRLDRGHVLAVVADDEGRVGDRVEDGLGDLGLAAARDRAGLVAQQAVGGGAHEAPGARAGVALHADAVARGVDVDLVRAGCAGSAARRLGSSARSGPRGI